LKDIPEKGMDQWYSLERAQTSKPQGEIHLILSLNEERKAAQDTQYLVANEPEHASLHRANEL